MSAASRAAVGWLWSRLKRAREPEVAKALMAARLGLDDGLEKPPVFLGGLVVRKRADPGNVVVIELTGNLSNGAVEATRYTLKGSSSEGC